ncbi:hypothetical protein H6764_02425 [Candidatus Nomurabacteria bacterium]|nr:hypothetical protein [Candidatus Nomurabacteria bacterium]
MKTPLNAEYNNQLAQLHPGENIQFSNGSSIFTISDLGSDAFPPELVKAAKENELSPLTIEVAAWDPSLRGRLERLGNIYSEGDSTYVVIESGVLGVVWAGYLEEGSIKLLPRSYMPDLPGISVPFVTEVEKEDLILNLMLLLKKLGDGSELSRIPDSSIELGDPIYQRLFSGGSASGLVGAPIYVDFMTGIPDRLLLQSADKSSLEYFEKASEDFIRALVCNIRYIFKVNPNTAGLLRQAVQVSREWDEATISGPPALMNMFSKELTSLSNCIAFGRASFREINKVLQVVQTEMAKLAINIYDSEDPEGKRSQIRILRKKCADLLFDEFLRIARRKGINENVDGKEIYSIKNKGIFTTRLIKYIETDPKLVELAILWTFASGDSDLLTDLNATLRY